MKLDHCVLPSANLAIARELLTRLGFTVAPDAAHPFGITSCRVFFEDGSYLESVVLADKNATRRASAAGNVFVQRDRRFRDAGGDEGFSALAFGTDDAALDHIRFVDGEMSAGDPLSFSRPFPDSSGNKTEASFKLAFAAPEDAPSFFFTCERVKTPAVDCSTLCQHANHVSGILRILVTASEPRAAGTFLSQFLQTGSGGGVWPLDNVVLSLLTDAKQVYNMDPDSDGNLRLRGIVSVRPPSRRSLSAWSLRRLPIPCIEADLSCLLHRDRGHTFSLRNRPKVPSQRPFWRPF
ncbi:VOC family protein [Chelativorans sp. J32]|uniref:VOC family protein n=1 Tax=Chelativorans sp. J32 TaxID=935840 RepID=UPI000A0262A5|nr:VOC family protein [Chelativorans sp. J32]